MIPLTHSSFAGRLDFSSCFNGIVFRNKIPLFLTAFSLRNKRSDFKIKLFSGVKTGGIGSANY